jgi:hypothetical protein
MFSIDIFEAEKTKRGEKGEREFHAVKPMFALKNYLSFILFSSLNVEVN